MEDHVLSDVPELFHYTNAHGLKSILERRTLWASDCQMLNDAEEMSRGREIFLEVVREYMHEEDFGSFDSQFVKWRDHRVFVTCLSAAEDDLGLWRGYAPDDGYAIGFNSSAFNDLSSLYTAPIVPKLWPIHYDEDTYRQALRDAMPPQHGGEALCLIATHKGGAWRHEREWRIVLEEDVTCVYSHPPRETVQFRVGPLGALTPYVEISLPPMDRNEDKWSDPFGQMLSRIVVGPGRNMRERVYGLEALLHRNNLLTSVETSTVPLRR